jgi:hypothetical protein
MNWTGEKCTDFKTLREDLGDIGVDGTTILK